MSEKKPEKRDNSLAIRSFLIYLFFFLAGLGVIYRIVDLQLQEDDLRRLSEEKIKTLDVFPIPVERGVILAKNGDFLVQRSSKYIIAMDTNPQEKFKRKDMPDSIKFLLPDSVFYANVALLADSITALFGESDPSWEQQLREARERENPNRYFVISSQASIADYMRVQKFPILRERGKYNALRRLEENLDYMPPPLHGDLAHRTIGWIKKDTTLEDRNPVGLEGYFDTTLAGIEGRVLRKTISKIPINVAIEKEPRDGYNVTTTLDMTMQYIADKALRNGLSSCEADEGCAIVMDVKTGDILAIVNLKRTNAGEYSERESVNVALTNYEPGSTFKTAGLMVALDEGKVTPDTPIKLDYDKRTGRTAKIGYREVRDDYPITKYDQIPPLWYIFAKSSNVGSVRAIYHNYDSNPQQFINGLYKLGFNETLHFPVFGDDKKPLLQGPDYPETMWSRTSLSTIPMGYEVTVAPLHLLTFYNAIANNGCMVKPRLVTKISTKDDKTILEYGVDTLNPQICSPQTLRYMSSMLDSVVTCGTAQTGFINAPYTVAGKTGTSKGKVTIKKNGVEETFTMYNLSFYGYFPADNPKYSCVILVRKRQEKSGLTGGKIAVPIFREIADKIYAMTYDFMSDAKGFAPDANPASVPMSAKVRSAALKTIFNVTNFNIAVPLTSNWVNVHSNGQNLSMEEVAFLGSYVVPDVKNMSLTDAIYILERAGMTAEIKTTADKKNYGRVKKQTPEPNAPFPRNRKMILELDIES